MSSIILVQDNPALGQTYAATLGGYGHDVKVAQNGEEALALAAAQRPDLVIAIDAMPLVEGVPLINLFNGTPKLNDLRMIIFTVNHTTNGQPGATRMYHRLYDDQLTPDQLSATVNDVLTRYADGQPGQSSQPIPAPPMSQPVPPPFAAPPASSVIHPTNQ